MFSVVGKANIVERNRPGTEIPDDDGFDAISPTS